MRPRPRRGLTRARERSSTCPPPSYLQVVRKVTLLAVDLEGTLVSTAVSAFARPGLAQFLTWANSTFPTVVLFTSVPAPRARAVVAALVELGEAPGWFRDIEIVEAAGSVKDLLRLVPSLYEALLVDDQQTSSAPGQEHRLVLVPSWVHPYPGDDQALHGLPARIDQAARSAGRHNDEATDPDA